MSDTNSILDAIRRRSAQRRDVLKYAGQATAVAGGLTLLSACGDDLFDQTNPSPAPSPTPSSTPTPAPAPTSTSSLADADVPYFQFLLNIEYLRASFFLMVSGNPPLPAELTSGIVGTKGNVDLTPPPTKVLVTYNTMDTGVFAPMFATEMANNTKARIAKFYNLLGAKAIAVPHIDIAGAKTSGAWFTLSRLTGVSNAPDTFNPSNAYASFVAASCFLNSTALAAYRGVVPKLTKGGANTLAGFIGAMSYETALMRAIGVVQAKGIVTNGPLTQIQKFSDGVDTKLDGLSDLDQGAGSLQGLKSVAASNVVARDSNGLALARSPEQTLNVLYVNGAVVSAGGFFPDGVNGPINTSSDSTVSV